MQWHRSGAWHFSLRWGPSASRRAILYNSDFSFTALSRMRARSGIPEFPGPALSSEVTLTRERDSEVQEILRTIMDESGNYGILRTVELDVL